MRRAAAGLQHGAVMVVALVVMLSVTLLALFAAEGALLDERIAGNERDRTIALQAAEAALRDAEASLPLLVTGVADCSTVFAADCSGGLCAAPLLPPAEPMWTNREALAVRYGRFTGAPSPAFNGRQPEAPRFLIEWFQRNVQFGDVQAADDVTRRGFFRIYAWGYGLRRDTRVLLETLIAPVDNECSGLP